MGGSADGALARRLDQFRDGNRVVIWTLEQSCVRLLFLTAALAILVAQWAGFRGS